VEQQAAVDAAQLDDNDAQQDVSGSSVSGSRNIYLRVFLNVPYFETGGR
jgi:hypothetical protein